MVIRKMNLIIVYLISGLICGVHNFNFDTRFPIAYENPGHENNTFGYSVILYEGRAGTPPWIQIGAPKFKNEEEEETGQVYRCGIKQPCSLLDIDFSRKDSAVLKVVGASLGHSMDISPDGSIFAACGHRYVVDTTTDYNSKGFCQWGNTNENFTEQRIPFSDRSSTIGTIGNSLIYAYGNGQAGFSLQFANQNKTDPFMIVGAPGVYNWAGTAFLWSKESGSVGAARRRRRSSIYQQFSIFESNNIIRHLSLAGYSVTSGYFVNKNRLDYAFGAPRSEMIGEIYLLNDVLIKYGPILKGVQHGEYYGGSLASADLNGDGYSDIIVGAPTYKATKYNEGKIYIYAGNNDPTKLISIRAEIVGKDVGAQFGDSITSLGDIDFDGYDDIAVAATYSDNGVGTVYIYRGTSSIDMILHNPQVIKGKEIQGLVPGFNIKAFGHSIARPRDIDGNKYNDLAIGAYKSEQAFIFRARPVITLEHQLNTNPKTIEHGTVSFNLTFSVMYKTKRQFENPKLTLISNLIIDPTYKRTSVESLNKLVLEGPGIPTVQTYNVKIVKDDSINIYKEMDYTVSYELEDPTVKSEMILIEKNVERIRGNDEFCKFCPVFQPETGLIATGSVSFNLGCGDDNKCHSTLHMNTWFKDINKEGSNIFIIGSTSYITMVTEVSNTGDKAYVTKLSVILPNKPKVTLRKLPVNCKLYANEVTCPIANPLELQKKTVELELDMSQVNEDTNAELLFNVSVSTISENGGDRFKEVQLLARKKADIIISGRSKEEYYTFDNTSSTVEFTQVLQIQKEGSSSLDNVKIDIEVPVSYNTVSFVEMYQPTLKEQQITCDGATFHFIDKNLLNYADTITSTSKRRRRSAAEDVTQKFQHFTGFYINCSDDQQIKNGLKCEKFQCSTRSIRRDVVEILFKFRLHIGKIGQDILGESDVIVFSTNYGAKIDDRALQDKIHPVVLSSVLVGPNVEKMVPIWIIIVAVLSGVIVLAVIAFVLYKCGFFKREKKELLKNEMRTDLEATEATHLETTEDD